LECYDQQSLPSSGETIGNDNDSKSESEAREALQVLVPTVEQHLFKRALLMDDGSDGLFLLQ
jgi:hypothetical protein